MRIIGGTFRGRRLHSPGGRPGRTAGSRMIRPTLDRYREAVFNIIGLETEGATVLDLFAGTGALGLEAMSRGAVLSVFVDRYRQSLELIGKNIEACGCADRTIVIKRDLTRGLHFLAGYSPPGGFSLIFSDPPYGKGLSAGIVQEIEKRNLLGHGGLLVAEDAEEESLPEKIGTIYLASRREYGDSAFWLFRRPPGDERL